MSTSLTFSDYRKPRALLLLGILFLVVVGVGPLIGMTTAPGAWFAGLVKPRFNPPSWVFAPVWFTLYVLIAIAGWRTFLVAPRSTAMVLWVVQMPFNWAWSPVFFLAHAPWLALVIVSGLLLLLCAFVSTAWSEDKISSILFMPYAAWVTFSTYLNLSIASLN